MACYRVNFIIIITIIIIIITIIIIIIIISCGRVFTRWQQSLH